MGYHGVATAIDRPTDVRNLGQAAIGLCLGIQGVEKTSPSHSPRFCHPHAEDLISDQDCKIGAHRQRRSRSHVPMADQVWERTRKAYKRQRDACAGLGVLTLCFLTTVWLLPVSPRSLREQHGPRINGSLSEPRNAVRNAPEPAGPANPKWLFLPPLVACLPRCASIPGRICLTGEGTVVRSANLLARHQLAVADSVPEPGHPYLRSKPLGASRLGPDPHDLGGRGLAGFVRSGDGSQGHRQ